MKEKQQMKKLMFTAAVAAMSVGAFAEGFVYEMNINLKTTTAKAGTVEVKIGDEICYTADAYRKQSSLKLTGLFWGCNCNETLFSYDLKENYGVFFWNATDKAAFYNQEAEEYIQPEFQWVLLNRIGQKATECEGVWSLNFEEAYLFGAGFGKVKYYEDSTQITSLGGNCAGWVNPGDACKRCSEKTAPSWPLCECGEATGDLTAAYGTWTLKFNASAAKKFNDTTPGDWSWYKWPGDVLEAIKALMEGSTGGECEDAKAELKKLNLQLEQLDVRAAVIPAEITEYNRIIQECNDKEAGLKKTEAEALAAQKVAVSNETSCTWTIVYTNGSEQTVIGQGCAALTKAAEDLKYFTLAKCTINLPDAAGWKTCYTWAEVNAAVKVLTDETIAATKTAEAATAAVTANDNARNIASQGILSDTEELKKIPDQRATLKTQITAQEAKVYKVCD